MIVLCLISLAMGYWFGSQQTSKAFSNAYRDSAAMHEIAEARHDAGLVMLLTQEQYKDAKDIAQDRYYSRLLLIEQFTVDTKNWALIDQANTVLHAARKQWKRDPYSLPNASKNQQLLLLMQ